MAGIREGEIRDRLADEIVDTAVDEAGAAGWGALRLRRVADRLGISLAELGKRFRDKDAVADAWLARADVAMLSPRTNDFAGLPARERLAHVIMSWMDVMASHRAVTCQMLAEKLYLGHPHHNVALVLRVSRTVQWIREAALLDATGRRKQVEEVGLSALFIATVWRWSADDSDGQIDTRAFLIRRLSQADLLMARLWPAQARKKSRD